MFVEYPTNLNSFKLGYQMLLFMDGCHWSGPYKRTIQATCALDSNNHLFNFAYAIVSAKSTED